MNPRVTSDILNNMNIKNKLFSHFLRKTENSESFRTYQQYRNELNQELKITQNAFFSVLFKVSALKSSEKTQRRLYNDNISSAKYDTKFSGTDLANAFNGHFESRRIS